MENEKLEDYLKKSESHKSEKVQLDKEFDARLDETENRMDRRMDNIEKMKSSIENNLYLINNWVKSVSITASTAVLIFTCAFIYTVANSPIPKQKIEYQKINNLENYKR